MYIKQLEIDNFKSFANKIEIPLLKGFTTISGPNGSGKSNIIDSVLFALGLSTSRTLRAEKLFHLISTYTKKNEAFVKVTFAENDEGAEFSVARKIKKSSQGYNSIYYLDDKIVTLTDIHTKLEKYNITPNSYNVMMQGDVTSITNCTPNERRKIIDEIAGVADFDRRIEQATGELTTVEQRVERAMLIINEVNARIEELKEQREIALKYQKLREDKVKLEGQVTTVKFFDLRKNLEKAHENILEFTKKKKEEEVKVKDLDERLNLIKKEYQEVCDLVREKGEAHQIEVKKQAEELKGAISRKESAIAYADKQIQDGLKSIENFKNGIETQEKKIKDNQLQIKLKQEELLGIQENIDKRKAELKKILEDMTGLDQTAEQHVEKRNALRKELEDLKDKETTLIQKQAPLEAELASLRRLLNESKDQLEKLQKFKADFSSNKDKNDLMVEQLGKDIEDLKLAQQGAMRSLDQTKNEIEDLEYNIKVAQSKIYKLEATRQASRESNATITIDTIMNAKINGVHAPLMELGKVDKEYATALEIAVGGRMGHIVVDDPHVASVCIEVLNSARAGRATFIPLNKIVKAPSSLHLPKEKGVIDFAINLIDFDDEYIDAFFYAVGDTVIVEDQATARKLIGKYRMVTLNGELFEKSGAITGGTGKKSGLKFSQNDDEELTSFKAKLEEMENLYKSLITKKQDLERKIDKIRVEYSASMTEYNKAQLELKVMHKDFDTNQASIDEKTEIIKKTEPRIEEISNKLDKMEEEMITISEQMTNCETQITDVEKLMDNEELKKLKEQTESVEFEIKRLESHKMGVNNDILSANQMIAFIETTIKTHSDNIARTTENNENLERDKKNFQAEIESTKEQLAILEEQIKEITEKLGALMQQRDEINKQLIDLETQKNLKIADVEKTAEQIESFKARRRELEPVFEATRKELEDAGVQISELEPTEMSIDEINAQITKLQKKMDDLGAVNMRAVEEYDNMVNRQTELQTQIDTLSKERLLIMERMQGYEDLKKETFLKTYNHINNNFKEVFHALSDGEGTLILENMEAPFTGGLTIEAQPRDKKKQRLESMSGGEKSLTALAFVFAIQRYMPAPFYAFDEVDANLDGINVEKLANIVQLQAKDTQFIVVSHRKPMIESANRTIGVTQKEKGISKVTGVKLRD